jgi:hypothetical protein
LSVPALDETNDSTSEEHEIMPNYRIIESVGRGIEPVTDWASIEPHHPSQRQQEAGRVYARVNGDIEEVAGNYAGTAVYTPGGQLMVSKDFILENSQNGSQNVPVPSPANGVIGEVDRRNGFVTILDRPGGEVMFQLRHMAIGQEIQPGTRVEYGQPLGTQSGYGRGDPNHFGTHVHIDANVKYLDQADRYIRDMASGVITTDTRPQNVANQVNEVPRIEQVSGTFPPPPPQALADGKIEFNERGPDVARLQEALRNAGAIDSKGQPPGQDGHFGNQTREALLNYKETYNRQHPDAPLPLTPVADQQTLTALGMVPASRANQQETPQPQQPPQPQLQPQQPPPPQQSQQPPPPLVQPEPAQFNQLDDKARALYRQIDALLGDKTKVPEGTFANAQERSNAALALTAQAYGKLNQVTDAGVKDGVLAVSDGRLGEPASKSAHLRIEDAVRQTPDESLRQLTQKQNEPQQNMPLPSVQPPQQQRSGMQP